MSFDYAANTSTKRTPQTQKVVGIKKQVHNQAGGISFKISKWKILERFLIIGTEGGTYYVGENKMTLEATKNLVKCIEKDGIRTVDMIVDVSFNGNAFKNDPALYALALCAAAQDTNTRKYALDNLHKVARITTHLFTFIKYVSKFRGWGSSLKKAVAAWYQDMPAGKLAYQVIKYKSREGFTHRDVLRLSHPKPADENHDAIYKYLTGKIDPREIASLPVTLNILRAAEEAKTCTNKRKMVNLITDYNLTHEMVPNDLKGEPEVWEALLQHMPMTAMIRNLGKMTSIGLVKPFSAASKLVVETLGDAERLRKSRVHPLTILQAGKIYDNGKGVMGNLTWTPVPQILTQLDAAFYASFKNVEPTGKNVMLAIDVSSSMKWTGVAGMQLFQCSEIAAAMALVTANVEPNYMVMGFAKEFRDLGVKASDSLQDAMRKTNGMTFGATDCSRPMLYAFENKLDVDAFVIYSDGQTWAGFNHPWQALEQFRYMKPEACMANVQLSPSNTTLAKPGDTGMIDIVGFSADTPAALSMFMKGEI